MAENEDLNTSKIALVGFLGTMILFVLITFLIALFYRAEAHEQQAKVIDQPAVEFDKLAVGEQQQLASFRWMDQEKQLVSIPIDQAMGLTLEELGKPDSASAAAPEKKSHKKSKSSADC
jgi:hypothetical protein